MKIKRNILGACILFFILAFIPRIYKISQSPMFPDEIIWMVRAKETFLAVRTFNSNHIINYFKDSGWWNIQNDTESIALPLVAMTGPFIAYLGVGGGILSRNVLPDFVVGRIPVAIVSSFSVVIFYLLGRKIVGEKIAKISTTLYLLDPVSIAHSRLIMNDGLLVVFILLSIYSYFYIKNYRLSVILSSFGLVLGFLTKPIGIIPLFAFVSFAIFSDNKKLQSIKLLKTIFLTLVTISVLWPASWFNPLTAITEYMFRQYGLVMRQLSDVYFFGNVVQNPPAYYYAVQIIFRIPSYILIGLSGFILVSLKNIRKLSKIRKSERLKLIAIFSFNVLFYCILSFSSKKSGIRYALPVLPFIYLSSCWFIYKYLHEKVAGLPRKALFTAPFVMGLLNLYFYSPNYDYYYSELLGGSGNSQKYLASTLCYGAKESAEYVKKCFPTLRTINYVGCSRTVVPYYFPGVVVSDLDERTPVIVEEQYKFMNYIPEDVMEYIGGIDPIIVKRNGLVLSRVYLKDGDVKNTCGQD